MAQYQQFVAQTVAKESPVFACMNFWDLITQDHLWQLFITVISFSCFRHWSSWNNMNIQWTVKCFLATDRVVWCDWEVHSWPRIRSMTLWFLTITVSCFKVATCSYSSAAAPAFSSSNTVFFQIFQKYFKSNLISLFCWKFFNHFLSFVAFKLIQFLKN